MEFKIISEIEKEEGKVKVRVLIERHSGDVNLEVYIDDTWRTIAWVTPKGEVKAAAYPPPGFSS